MISNITMSCATKPLHLNSSDASHQLYIKLKILERLVKEMAFRNNETNVLQEKLSQEEHKGAEAHVVNRAHVLYEEAKSTESVTLSCLQRECKETDVYITETFGELLQRKDDKMDSKEEDDLATVTIKKIVDMFNAAVKYLPKLREELVLLQPTHIQNLNEEEEEEI